MVKSFLEFLRDSKCCVLNGRKNLNDDHFTSLSVRGKAVVDYIVTPHNCLDSCLAFKVITAIDLIDQNAATCMNLIGGRCHLPDHSLLLLTFKVGVQITEENESVSQSKKRSRTFPENVLSSDMCRFALSELIKQLESCQSTQNSVDRSYNEFCDMMILEMDKCQPKNLNKYKSKQLARCSKPFWNSGMLQKLWNVRKIAEKNFLRCNDPVRKQQLRENYRQA